MTPETPTAQPENARVVGLLVGLFTGLALCGCLMGGAGWALVSKVKSDTRRGWNLVPVVVAKTALPMGRVLTMDDVSQRSVPEQFVTSSVVKPDSASYLVGQALTVPVSEGEPLLWSQFASARSGTTLGDQPLAAACEQALLAREGPPKVSTLGALRDALKRGRQP